MKRQKEKAKKSGTTKKQDEPSEVADVPTVAPDSTNASEERTTLETTAPLEDGKPEASESNKDAPGTQDEAPHSSNDTPDESTASVPSASKPPHNRQPSLSIQSKMRSSSFRRTSISQGPMSPSQNGPRSPSLPVLSPEGDAVTDIYRKQASRLDELERENRRLAKEAAESSTRWKSLETELEELRESSGNLAELRSRAQATSSKDAEISHLQNENTSLDRQLSQLQSSTSKRHASSPSSQPPPSSSPSSLSSLQAQLDSKITTVDSMEMEISTLRSQLSTATTTSTSHREQIAALEEKVDRAERAAGSAQRELLDVRKNLDRASEKAVRDGSERTSAETKLRSLTREAEESDTRAEDATKRTDTLEKKLAALTTLHKDSDSRRQASEKQHSLLEREAAEMRRRLASIENENLRLREAQDRHRKRDVSGDADGMDELEDEERQRLEQKVRSLETEVFELRRGVWRDKRRAMSGSGPASPGGKFDDVDLTGPNVSSPFGARRQSMASGFTNALSNGFSAFTGGGRRGSDALLSDDGVEFDEEAWRGAQEEEGRKRVERVREVKRGLKGWEGWRMDLVDVRGGVAGLGEVFDV